MDQPKPLHVDKPWGSFDQFSLNEKVRLRSLLAIRDINSVYKNTNTEVNYGSLSTWAPWLKLTGNIIDLK